LESFAPVPGLISERNRVCACGDEFLVDRLSDAEALIRGILAIDNAQIDPPLRDAARKMGSDCVTADLPDDVTNEQNSHVRLPACEGAELEGHQKGDLTSHRETSNPIQETAPQS
jgi:hypothetical protein